MSGAVAALATTPSKAISNLALSSPKPPAISDEIPPSPGTFRHPRLTEIVQRQSASSLTSQKIQTAGINVAAIAITYIFGSTFDTIIHRLLTLVSIPPSTLDASTLLFLLRTLFFVNTALCMRPILPYISRRDDITDIPLTHTQRALLGLPASTQNSPATAAGSAAYVTPPRYRRDGGVNSFASVQNNSANTSTGRRSISANYSPSPTSTSRHTFGLSTSPQQANAQSGRGRHRTTGSPFAGSPANSPLLHRTMTSELNQSTFTTVGGRASLGASTSSFNVGLSRSQSVRERNGGLESIDNLPGTPSPSGPKRQPGVNYKWLYDKGARLPKSESTGF